MKVLRVKQWLKNFLLFIAPISAAVEVSLSSIYVASRGFIVFCAVSSIGYIANDWTDRKRDRLHHTKRNRPIANGSVSTKQLTGYVVTLILIGVVVSLYLSMSFKLIVFTYLCNTFLYSFYFKHYPIIEMIMVSLGFFLRLLAGAALFDLEISEWFYLISIFGSLFIVAIKRNNEVKLSSNKHFTREVLRFYTVGFLESLISVFLTLTIMTYCLWALSYKSGNVPISISIITFLISMLNLFFQSVIPITEAPEDFIFGDRLTRFSLLTTFALVSVGIYLE